MVLVFFSLKQKEIASLAPYIPFLVGELKLRLSPLGM